MPFDYNLGDRTASEAGSFRQHAFDKLYEAIYDGTLIAGEELGEQELSEWLQMSRQPIRYALLHLADLGLVVVGNGRAPRVAPLDPARANRTLLVGGMYDAYVIDKTVETLTPEQLVRLDDAAADLEQACRDEDRPRASEAVDRFFRVFVDAYGNSVIRAHFSRMSYELARFLQPGGSGVELRHLGPAVSSLNAAVRARDRERAVHIAQSMFAVTRHNFVEHFREPTR